MIWGYPHFRKPSYGLLVIKTASGVTKHMILLLDFFGCHELLMSLHFHSSTLHVSLFEGRTLLSGNHLHSCHGVLETGLRILFDDLLAAGPLVYDQKGEDKLTRPGKRSSFLWKITMLLMGR